MERPNTGTWPISLVVLVSKVIKISVSAVPIKVLSPNLVAVFMIVPRQLTPSITFIASICLCPVSASLVFLGKMANAYSTAVKESAQAKLL